MAHQTVDMGSTPVESLSLAMARLDGEQRRQLDAGVGAQWFLVHAAHAAILVSLVQTADMLPDVMFGIVGGVLADPSIGAGCGSRFKRGSSSPLRHWQYSPLAVPGADS
jgi:hypothetical protein